MNVNDILRLFVSFVFLLVIMATPISVLAIAWRRMRSQLSSEVARELQALTARIDRIATSVDAIAVEVERIGETERFAARLFAAKTDNAPALPPIGPEGRVITPH